MPRRVTQKEIKATRKDFLFALAEEAITAIDIKEFAWQYRINGVVVDYEAFAGDKKVDTDWSLDELFSESFRNEIIDGYNENVSGSDLLKVFPKGFKLTYQGQPVTETEEYNVEENSDS